MRLRALLLALFFILYSSSSQAGPLVKVTTSMRDTFLLQGTEQWDVRLERQLLLRFAQVSVSDKSGYPFNLILNFMADTPDLAKFDTPEKMEKTIRARTEKFLAQSVEKTIVLQKVPVASTYGFYTIITDAKVANNPSPPVRDFKYLTGGMIRLSPDTALEYVLTTNDTDSTSYRTLLDEFVYKLVRPEAGK